MNISTKSGDRGISGLYNGKRVKKSEKIFDFMGELDELSSFLGWVKVLLKEDCAFNVLHKLQNDLYRIMALSANGFSPPRNIKEIGEKDVCFLEDKIESLMKNLKSADGFLLPGVNEISARFHISRTVARRAERAFFACYEEEKKAESMGKYLNRLSDLLYVFALKFSCEDPLFKGRE